MTVLKPAVPWPMGVDSALCMTFDMDAETMWNSRDAATANRPSVVSQGRYDVGEGLANVLNFLSTNGITATFYVPSETAKKFKDEINEIALRGHEIGSHGTDHIPLDNVSRQEELDHLRRATDEIEDAIGVRPRGYRAPMYGITASVWKSLSELGYTHSSNMMDSVRPYVLDDRIVEFPVSWSLDDGPYFLVSYFPPNYRVPASPKKVFDIWSSEARGISSQGGATTLTLHPQLIGRPGRIPILQDLVDELRQRGNVWFTSHARIADHLLESRG